MKKAQTYIDATLIGLCALVYLCHEMGQLGKLPTSLENHLYPALMRIHSVFSDAKFRTRGSVPVKNKIAILAIDSDSLSQQGRWPWDRTKVAELVESTFEKGAAAVVVDILFPEPQELIPPSLKTTLEARGLGEISSAYHTDGVLAKTLEKYRDQMVLSWASDHVCRPLYQKDCPTNQPMRLPFRYGIGKLSRSGPFQLETLPLPYAAELSPNIEEIEKATRYSGFANALRDPDGVIRRTMLVVTHGKRVFPSSALAAYRLIQGDSLSLKLDEKQRVENLSLLRTGEEIHITPLGNSDINFRGGAGSFLTVSASRLLNQKGDRDLAESSEDSLTALLKDAYVFIGVTALAVGDIVATPFDSTVAGVEVQATVLDNLLSKDLMGSSSQSKKFWFILLLMLLVAPVFSLYLHEMEAKPMLITSTVFLSALVYWDFWNFSHQLNLTTSFFYIEILLLTASALTLKYITEERDRKFLRLAFSKYVAPAVVNSVVENPGSLNLGGRRETISVLFSDVRSFSTFSESMDAKAVGEFLNDYLGLMTEIVFDYRGTLDKYIGDAVMAFWGAPLPQTDQASRACSTAIEMMRTLQEHQARFLKDYGVPLNIGIGVHTGMVSVGNLGSDKCFDYTVIGDNVNLTSRLEAATKDMGVPILTSSSSLNHIAEAGLALPSHRPLGNILLKGKEVPVAVAELICREYSTEGLEAFAAGKKAFESRQWEVAKKCFLVSLKTLAQQESLDQPSQHYLESIARYEKFSPKDSDSLIMWKQVSK